MKIAFYTPGWKQPELDLFNALKAGMRRGEQIDSLRNSELQEGYDLSCVVGVKSLPIVRQLEARGMPFLYWDKGYHRDWPAWWRVAIDAHQPTEYIAHMHCGDDRMRAQGWTISPWRERGDHIVIAGSSLKYNNFHGLEHPTEMAQKMVDEIQFVSNRRIVYRPKPSWQAATPILGTSFSWTAKKNFRTLTDEVKGAHACVTYGSNACFEAMLVGVPSVVTGDAALRYLFSNDLCEIEEPRLAHMDERQLFTRNLAYCQWSLEEMRGGDAWRFMRAQLEEMGKI